MLEKYPDLAETERNIYKIQANYESQYRICTREHDAASQLTGFSPFSYSQQSEQDQDHNHNHNKKKSKIKSKIKTKKRNKTKRKGSGQRKRGRPRKKKYDSGDEDYYGEEEEESEIESENENEIENEIEFEGLEEEEMRDSDHESNKWCVCQQPSSGDMIKCDNVLCETQWFHWKCMRIMKVPKDKWYCKACRKYPTKSNLLHAKFDKTKTKKKKKRRR